MARAVAGALKQFLPPPSRVLLSGGGVRNGFLWHLLEQQLEPIALERTDYFGIPADARKAVVAAGLAALALDGMPANAISATGASGTRLLGSFTPGTSANWTRCLNWMASQSLPPHLAAA